MIRHVVMWKLAGDDEAARSAAFREVRDALEPLVHLDGIRTLTVVRNELAIDGNFEAVLVADYESQAALENYLVHPEHVAAVAIVRANTTARAAIDYSVQ